MTKLAKGVRMKPLARKQRILEAAVQLSIETGYRKITKRTVALSSDSAPGLIHRYFKTVANLKHEVIKEAIHREIMPILVEYLSDKELTNLNLTFDLKQKVIEYLNH